MPSDAYPLGLREGDCDGDSDCTGDLVCHQRDGSDPVPSCAGRGDSKTDYCIHSSDESARPPVVGNSNSATIGKTNFGNRNGASSALEVSAKLTKSLVLA